MSVTVHQVGPIDAGPVRCGLCGKILVDQLHGLTWREGQSVYFRDSGHGGREIGPTSNVPDCSIRPPWIEDIVARLERIELLLRKDAK
jgi:hypothetical protein